MVLGKVPKSGVALSSGGQAIEMGAYEMGAEKSAEKRARELENEYMKWKNTNLAEKVGFFAVFNGFRDLLAKLSPGAVKLYIFLGLASHNWRGFSYYSISHTAKYLGVSTRTVQNWLKELEEKGLIERLQHTRSGIARTYLRPYTAKATRRSVTLPDEEFVVNHEKEDDADDTSGVDNFFEEGG